MQRKASNNRESGFSILEIMIVVALSIIVTAIAVPSYQATLQYLRIAGDLRDLNGLTAQAKMRAAANFTHARVYADLTNNTYQLQVWNKTAGCWVADVDSNKANCITYGNAPAPSGPGNMALSQGNTYGYGSLTAGPTPGQSTIGQAAKCYKDNGTSPINKSACIVFNSRGVPIKSDGSPDSSGAFYITNTNVVDAVTVSATGSIQTWSLPYGSSTWHGQ